MARSADDSRSRMRRANSGETSPPGRRVKCSAEFVRHLRAPAVGVVDAHRQDEHGAVGDVAGTVDGVAPFAAEIALEPALRRRGDDWNEERAAGDVALDLAVVIVAALQALQVEPGLDAGRVEAGLHLLHGRQVFARVADEDRVVGHFALGRQETLRRRAQRNDFAGLARVQRRCSSSTNFSAPL